uniref:Uncharacterized protein n=1 Tax=Cycas taitungensis TaxID=54799 RepID=A6H5N9_CYCTA|nr:hypothetical protein CYtaCp098 [Cycas taitungensis]BAF65005.1 hypothetical protein [Cycas taitungensis]
MNNDLFTAESIRSHFFGQIESTTDQIEFCRCLNLRTSCPLSRKCISYLIGQFISRRILWDYPSYFILQPRMSDISNRSMVNQ